MKKKMLALLVAVTLCMVLIAMPFSASAASSVSYRLGDYYCYGNLSRGTSSLNEPTATATTTYGTRASYLDAAVKITVKLGKDYHTKTAGNEMQNATGTTAYVNSGYSGSAFVSAEGEHYVSTGVASWGYVKTNL